MTDSHRSRGRARTGRWAGALAACLAATTALAPGAAAAAAGDQWWVTGFNLAQNHTIADGSGVTVAVLDGTFSTNAPSVAGIDLVPPATNECVGLDGAAGTVTADGPGANHATQMVSVLAGKGANGGPLGAAPGAKVLVYNIGTTSADSTAIVCRSSGDGLSIGDEVAGAAINDAVAKGARVVSMSFGGGNYGAATQTAILYAERKGVVFVAATNDQATDNSRIDQPSIFNGLVVVNGIDPDSALIANSATGADDGPLVTVAGPGADMAVGGYTAPGTWDAGLSVNGSSTATAFVSGVLATTLSKYPDATGNQLVQSLARNTGGTQHDLGVRGTDGFGFGTVSLTSMLENDPTAYPDENPLLRDGADPPTSEILQGSSSSSSPPSSESSSGSSAAPSSPSSSTPVAAADDGGGSTGLIVGIVVGVVVLLALVALVIVLVQRNRRSGGPPVAGGPPPTAAPGAYR